MSKAACNKVPKKLRPKNKKQATDLMAAYVRILANKTAKNQKSASDSPLQRLAPAIQKHGDFFKALNEVYANKSATYRVKIAKGLVAGLNKKIAAAAPLMHPELHDAPAPDVNQGAWGQIGDTYKRFLTNPIQQTKHVFGGGEYTPGGGRPNPTLTFEQNLRQKYPHWFEDPKDVTEQDMSWLNDPNYPAEAHQALAGSQSPPPPPSPSQSDVNTQALANLDGHPGQQAQEVPSGSPPEVPSGSPPVANASMAPSFEGIKKWVGEHPGTTAGVAGGTALTALLYHQYKKNQQEQEEEAKRQEMMQALIAQHGGGTPSGGGKPSRVLEYL